MDLAQFGCGLRQLIFAPLGDSLTATLTLQINQALGQWLAGVINVTGVTVNTSDDTGVLMPGNVNITVSYTLVESQANLQTTVVAVSVDPAHDRLGHLLSGEAPPSYNGIDFVEVSDLDPTQLRVHFLNTASRARDLLCDATGHDLRRPGRLGSADRPTGRRVRGLVRRRGRAAGAGVTVAQIGDAPSYSLTIYSTALDPYFDAASFSFPSALTGLQDCQAPAPSSPPETATAVPITYLAKDFQTFRQALLDYSALAYPLWVERSEPDLGMVLIEALSAIGDELSYLQDRVAGEADRSRLPRSACRSSTMPTWSTTTPRRRSRPRRRSSSTSPPT